MPQFQLMKIQRRASKMNARVIDMRGVELKHIVTQVVGAFVAAMLIAWAMRQARFDWEQKRIPLVRGSFSMRVLGVVLAALGVLALVLYAVIALHLLPRSNVLAFVGFFVWMGAILVAGMIGGISDQLRRGAEGWLTILGDNVMAIESAGERVELTLRESSVALRFVARAPEDVQFVLRDEDKVAHFWGAIPTRLFSLVTEGPPLNPRGLMVSSSMKPLLEWLTPFIAR
jgi:hypothetical protein